MPSGQSAGGDERHIAEGIESLKSYLRKAKSKEQVTPTDYQNPFTRQPFEKDEELFDYWIDLLDKLPKQPNLGPNPK
jgi:hypothetical protein